MLALPVAMSIAACIPAELSLALGSADGGGGEEDGRSGGDAHGSMDANGVNDANEENVTTADAGTDVVLPDGGVYLVFVTSQVYTGALGGLAGADSTCQSLATAAHLPGAYKAWLSDDTQSADTRLTHGALPYALVDGTLIANDWADLTSGALRHAIDKTETGGAPLPSSVCDYGDAATAHAWTDTLADGAPFPPLDSCSEWTVAASPAGGGGGPARIGTVNATDLNWTDSCGSYCDPNWNASLYCMEQ